MSDIVERAEERLSVSRLGKSSHRETDKDLVVIADLLAEVKQLEGEVFAWRMRNHKLADEVKRLTPREITNVGDLNALPFGSVVLDDDGMVYEYGATGEGDYAWYRGDDYDMPGLPALVIYIPEV